jgi:hypothetical protein
VPYSVLEDRGLKRARLPMLINYSEQGKKMWSKVGGEEVMNLVGSMSGDKYTCLYNASIYLHSFLLSRSTLFTTPPYINAPRALKLGKRKYN